MDERVARAVEESIQQYRDMPGGLLPLLHALQDALGFVPAEAVPAIASRCTSRSICARLCTENTGAPLMRSTSPAAALGAKTSFTFWMATT